MKIIFAEDLEYKTREEAEVYYRIDCGTCNFNWKLGSRYKHLRYIVNTKTRDIIGVSG